MPTTPSPTPAIPNIRGITLALYWGSLALGFMLPWVMTITADVFHRQRSLAEASTKLFADIHVRLFAPSDGTLFLALLSMAPFVVYAVFTLLHLGKGPRLGTLVTHRRLIGVLCAAIAMIVVSVWGHYSILTARGSTAGIGFIFLPFYVLFAMLLGYGLGRLLARRWLR
jgi:hypothetical protein